MNGGGFGIYVVTIPPATTPLVFGREDVEHDPSREGGTVTDGLYPGYGAPSLQESFRQGPKEKLRSLHDIGLPPQCHLEETHQVPWTVHAAPSPDPDHPGKRGWTFSGHTEVDNEAKGAVSV